MGLYKLVKYLAYGLGILGFILGVMIISGSTGVFDSIIYLTYVVLFIIVAIVLIYVIKGLFTGNVKKTFLSLGLFFGIFLISYLLSSGTDLDLKQFSDKGLTVSEGISKNTGAGLYMFYILMASAIVAMLLSSVKNMFSK